MTFLPNLTADISRCYYRAWTAPEPGAGSKWCAALSVPTFTLNDSITVTGSLAYQVVMAAGTGKSSLVNALCIGLGGKPNVSRHGVCLDAV